VLGSHNALSHLLYGSDPWGPEDDSGESEHVAFLKQYSNITYTTLLCFDCHVLSYVFYKHFGMKNINFKYENNT
jgi:hypothetical protein